MANMSTALTEFSDSGDRRAWSTSGHTPSLPRMVIQTRKVPNSVNGVAETSIKVVHGTENADSEPIDQKVSFEVVVRSPLAGQASDVTAALAIFRDIVAGDEFGLTVTSQNYLT